MKYVVVLLVLMLSGCAVVIKQGEQVDPLTRKTYQPVGVK
jgi:uncharacterized protein YceK